MLRGTPHIRAAVFRRARQDESAARGRSLGFADGGYVSGANSSRSDSIPARLSNGEFVVTADATRRHRALLEAINNGGNIAHFAKGGIVAPAISKAPAIQRGGSVSIAPVTNIRFEGGSRGQEADQELAARIGKTAEATTRQVVVDEMRRQMRPGGIMR